ncbi:uncharacterized protein [Triticum aestivum]|uniref:uncharacterized protein isoform X2 n=1 Tax=Triticum aestivum TaxID=4565 RepID=UPI001D02081A|nr:uncharacterized protein LOC123135377 isoform X2 [Triticum aestivum]
MGDQSVLERIVNGDEDPKDLPLPLLQSITNDFSHERKIGQGGFGEVYKGVLTNGITVVVKRIIITLATIDDILFRREVYSLMTINHQNVVRFFGFCSNTHHKAMKESRSGEINLVNVRERLLCFEYISNGSLDKHITDELRGLEWETRYEIITGICKGLRYLHEEKSIIHLDLKPSNILLDDRMVPRIIDFGLARPSENSHDMGQHFGTRGYIAPEYEHEGETSVKSDIYSLGAIIIQLITGHFSFPNKNNVIRRWRHRWSKPPTLLQYQQVTKCIEMAVRCRKQEPEDRPSISEIISILTESESTDERTVQMIPCYVEDDMLGIKPLELKLPSELKEEISSFTVELTNATRHCIAFNILLQNRQQYEGQPDKGIVQPESKFDVKIVLPPFGERYHADMFIVQSMKVSDDLIHKVITESMFHEEAGKVVDEVNLMVVYEPTKPQENLESREDTNMPAEEAPMAKERDGVEFASKKGNLGSSEKAEKKLLDSNASPMSFPIDFLKSITCDFSTDLVLGEGGFGAVYKGVLRSGKIIAVKRLFETRVKEDTFQSEVSCLMRIKHPNLVQFLGYCAESSWEAIEPPSGTGHHIFVETPKRLLCFEYVPNKGLNRHISDESSGLEWDMRYEIIKGICNGLHFLHDECYIVHLDLKPENILMDSTMMPKIADFGLSKIVGEQQS